MKYIARHLPVNEIIKIIGDKVFVEGEFIEHSLDTQESVDFANKQNYPLWKLFLCNREIQVGQKVVTELPLIQEGIESWSEGIVTEVHGRGWVVNFNGVEVYCNRYHLLNVNGPISSGVKWVIEGDEFEEKDVRYKWKLEFTVHGGRGGKPEGVPRIISFNEKPTEDDAEDMASELSRDYLNYDKCTINWDINTAKIKYIELKCDKCDSFH